MVLKQENELTRENDLVQLVSSGNKIFLVRLIAAEELHTHVGVLQHDDLIGLPWGSRVASHTGSPFHIFRPGLADLLKEIKRNTQIMYPKDIGYILVQMGIGPGTHVVEAGTGSGAFTTALAWAVGPEGRVTTYESREQMQNLARKNLERLGLADRVEFRYGDIGNGFHERNVPALFLDLQNPYDYILQVKEAMQAGGHFGAILPTTPQVARLIDALERNEFAYIDVCEILLRYYKPVPARLRPTDRMVAHTGFLIFARPVAEPLDKLPTDETIEIRPEEELRC